MTTAAGYANFIMESYCCVLIPPVGCLVHVRFVSVPHGLKPELDAEVIGISIGPNLDVTLKARAGVNDPSAYAQGVDILPDEIVSVLHVPAGLENPYMWWRRPNRR